MRAHCPPRHSPTPHQTGSRRAHRPAPRRRVLRQERALRRAHAHEAVRASHQPLAGLAEVCMPATPPTLTQTRSPPCARHRHRTYLTPTPSRYARAHRPSNHKPCGLQLRVRACTALYALVYTPPQGATALGREYHSSRVSTFFYLSKITTEIHHLPTIHPHLTSNNQSKPMHAPNTNRVAVRTPHPHTSHLPHGPRMHATPRNTDRGQ